MRWKCRSRRDATTQPPARWSVGGHELRILHSLEETNLLLEVVEAAVSVILSIDDLPQQLIERHLLLPRALVISETYPRVSRAVLC